MQSINQKKQTNDFPYMKILKTIWQRPNKQTRRKTNSWSMSRGLEKDFPNARFLLRKIEGK